MRLLVITSTFPRWENDTTAAFVCELAQGLKKLDTDVVVLAPHFSGAKIRECWHSVSIHRFLYFLPTRFERLAYGPGLLFNVKRDFFALIGVPFFILSEFLWTSLIIRQKNVQIIHSHWLIPQGLIGAIYCKIKKIPHVATVHGSDLNIIKKFKILHPVCQFIVRNSDRITVNSTYMKRQLESVAPEAGRKSRVIPMGIDPQEFRKQNLDDLRSKFRSKYIILSVGRLIDIKGTIYLIKALPDVLSRHPDTVLLIAGDGPEKGRLCEAAYDLGLEKNICFLGAINHDEIPKYFLLADVFILPSINVAYQTEAQGVVLLEAMASGCPVIGSNVGGIPDIITDGENGFLVPEKDYKVLAEKIIWILSDEELQEKFRKKGLSTIQESFTWDIISEQFSEVYSEILNELKIRRSILP